MFHEKAFWAALIGVLVPLLNHFFQFGLEVGEVMAIMLPIIALILGVSWKDAEIAKAEYAVEAEMIRTGLYNFEE
jgi:hypothetical protein